MSKPANPPEYQEILSTLWSRSQEAFVRLYRLTMERVYRYHLAHSGDVLQAEDQTARTYLALIGGLDSYSPDSESLDLWVLGFAYEQHNHPGPALEWRQKPKPVSILPDDEVGLRMAVGEVSNGLQNLRPEWADSLALIHFAALSPEDAARVMGKRPGSLTKLAQKALVEWFKQRSGGAFEPSGESLAAFRSQLDGLREALVPQAEFVAELEEVLRPAVEQSRKEWATSASRGRSQFVDGRQRERRRRLWRLIAQWAVFALLVTLALNTFLPLAGGVPGAVRPTPPDPLDWLRPRATSTPVSITATPLVVVATQLVATTDPQLEANTQPGYLVPALEDCQRFSTYWDLTLAETPTVTDKVMIVDPAAEEGRQQFGFGCAVTVDGRMRANAYPLVDDELLSLFPADARLIKTVQWTLESDPATYRAFSDDAYGQVQWYYAGDQPWMAIHVRSWGPVEASNCTVMLTAEECLLVLRATEITTHESIIIAADLARPAIDEFLRRLQAGDDQALESLTPDLAAHIRSATDLQTAVGFNHDAVDPSVSAVQLLENWGDITRFAVLVNGSRREVSLAQIAGRWQVADLGESGLPYPPTEDAVIAFDQNGRLLRIDLQTGKQHYLSPPLVFESDRGSATALSFSPDQHWLVVSQSAPVGTWLVDYREEQSYQIGTEQWTFGWNATSDRLAFVPDDDRRTVYLLEVPGGGPVRLGTFDQDVYALAWAPDGQRLAVALADCEIPVEWGDPDVCPGSIMLVEPQTGRQETWQEIELPGVWPQLKTLAWTPDQSGLWYFPGRKIFPITPGADAESNGQNSLTFTDFSCPPDLWVKQRSQPDQGDILRGINLIPSPDRMWFLQAIVGGNTNSEVELNLEMVLQPLDTDHSSRSVLWTGEVPRVQGVVWTGDNRWVILSSTVRGPVLRVDPLNGEVLELGEQMTYLGLRSQLNLSTGAVLQPALVRLLGENAIGQTSEWPTRRVPGYPGMVFRAPAAWQWNTIQPAQELEMVLSNWTLEEPRGEDSGCAALPPSAFTLSFSSMDYDSMEQLAEAQEYMQEIVRSGQAIQVEQAQGIPTYEMVIRPDPSSRYFILLPEYGAVWLEAHYTDPAYDEILLEILNSFRLAD